MCRVYKTIGALRSVKERLDHHEIADLKSVRDTQEFSKSYGAAREEILHVHREKIEREKESLETALVRSSASIVSRKTETENQLLQELASLRHRLDSLSVSSEGYWNLAARWKQWSYGRKLNSLEATFPQRVEKALKPLKDQQRTMDFRHQYILSGFDDAIRESAQIALRELERKKAVIDQITPSVLGAIGEQKVVRTLQNLSDEYHLINDFSVSFAKPLYYSEDDDHICSIQIDHLLIGPSGIFIIETKNWSRNALQSLNLRSPVQQIRRSSFALYIMLSENIPASIKGMSRHRWGERKIPLKNLIVFINNKPREEFQYVKILTLDELLGYIRYFPPVFTPPEVQALTNFLLEMTEG